ncbi:hypothetical protein [Legionella sp. km772]|uniref:hypothetical protein n=1 Tax=Legionella sp. km772 TaxID=2498111 RepID=UPI000F8C5B19|nr:hypothetical protein [Legionella sp. km772]RUR10969.1 hypothetical protein ELY15_07595 [Legionella sp. km772]
MKYFLLGLFSLPLITACTVVDDPYGPPPPRAEVYRYDEPAHYHGHRGYEVRGAYPTAQVRPVPRHYNGAPVIVRPRNQTATVPVNGRGQVGIPSNTHGHGQVLVPRNTHGRGQAVVPNNMHGHGQVVVPSNTHGHGQAVVPQNTHGHGQATNPQNNHGHASQAAKNTVKKHPSENANQTPSATVTTH